MAEDEWSIVLYVEGSGRSPAGEFLESLDAKTLARFITSIEELRLRNVSAREPLVRHLEGKLWELRQQSGPNAYRLLYFPARLRRIVLLHGFQKKTQKTPRREIQIALRRMSAFVQREEGG